VALSAIRGAHGGNGWAADRGRIHSARSVLLWVLVIMSVTLFVYACLHYITQKTGRGDGNLDKIRAGRRAG
jgi:hypothetical protein